MHSIITEELRFRKRVCEYAMKYENNAEAARRYHTSRQQVKRWVKRFTCCLSIHFDNIVVNHILILINTLRKN